MIKNSKIILYLSLFCAFALLLPTTFVKAEEKSFVGASTVYEDKKGKTVNISLYIYGSEKITAGSVTLLYDQKALTVNKSKSKVVLGDQLTNSFASVNVKKAGKVSLEWAQPTAQQQEGTLLTLSAKLTKANETIDLDVVNVQLFTEDLNTLDVDEIDGAIKPFSGQTETFAEKVGRDKQWTIVLENDFNPLTVNKHTVRVKNRSGKEMDIILSMTNSKEFVVLPKTNYKAGSYTLEMTEQVRNINGEVVNQPKRLLFSVK